MCLTPFPHSQGEMSQSHLHSGDFFLTTLWGVKTGNPFGLKPLDIAVPFSEKPQKRSYQYLFRFPKKQRVVHLTFCSFFINQHEQNSINSSWFTAHFWWFFSAKSPLLGIKIHQASSRLLGQPLLHQARLKASSSFGQPEKETLGVATGCSMEVENHGNAGKNHGKPWKNHGKPWKNHGKPWKTLEKPWKNHGKTMENLGKTMENPILTIKIRCESMVYWSSS